MQAANNSAGQLTSPTDYLDGSPRMASATYRAGLLATQTDALNRTTRQFRDAVGASRP